VTFIWPDYANLRKLQYPVATCVLRLLHYFKQTTARRTKTLITQFGPPNHRGTASTAKRSIRKRIMERMPSTESFGSGNFGSGNVQSFGSGNVGCGNITSILNSNVTVNEIDEDNQIKKWLSPLMPQARHKSVQSEGVAGVGGWLLEKNEFRKWSSSQGEPKRAILFCYGDPGVGKTHMKSVRKPSQTTGYC